ncbi:Dynamin-binding protein [Halotydeus destructor]|nr:Dynamin-binding protein [Halotydeus destructor]
MNIGGIAKVTRDFESVVEGELSLRAGDLVQIVNSDNNDRHWAHVYCDDHEGEFPAGQLIALDCSDDILSHPEDLFVSKEDFYAEQDGDLSFSRGSVVSRTAIIDSNWSSGLVVFDGKTGRTVIGGKAGIFPLTFVWQIRRDLTTPSTYSANSNALNSADPRTPIATGIATDNLKAQLAEEVDLVKGDAVKIFSIHDRSYYNGECNGRRGIIPKAFVTLSKVDNVSAPRTVSPASRDTMPKFVEQSSAEDEPPTYENALRCPSVQEVDYATYQVNTDVVNSTQGVTSYCMTIYPFEGEFSTDLTFKSNEIVHIIRHVDADWLEGELNGRIGIFPKCFVKIVVDVHGHQEPVLQVDESNQEQMEVTNYPPDTYARVLFDFEAAHENDLAVKKNSTLTILRKLGEDWFEAMDDAGNIGEVPVVFVELIEERCHYTNDEDSSNAPLSRSTSAYEGEPLAASGPSLVTAAVLELSGSTISDFDPLDASSANVSHDSALLVAVNRSVSEDSQTTSSFSLRNITVNRTLPIRPAPPRPAAFTLSPRREPSEPSSTSSSSLPSSEDQEERRRQKVQEQRSCVIMELLQSERDYIRDLKVCYAQFEKPLISYPQLRGLIGNLSEVIQANQSLLSRLEVSSSRNGQGIGSCFLASADSLRPAYSIYCRNSDDVPVLFERLTSASGDSTIRQVLERSLKKIQEETNCFDIPSLLIKPVQRILKYPLLLSELAKCTTEATEVSEISKATTTMTDMATEINEMKRRKDMVFKYRKPSEVSSLTAKLSKINMHTLRKKGGRISARVYSTFRNVQRDQR